MRAHISLCLATSAATRITGWLAPSSCSRPSCKFIDEQVHATQPACACMRLRHMRLQACYSHAAPKQHSPAPGALSAHGDAGAAGCTALLCAHQADAASRHLCLTTCRRGPAATASGPGKAPPGTLSPCLQQAAKRPCATHAPPMVMPSMWSQLQPGHGCCATAGTPPRRGRRAASRARVAGGTGSLRRLTCLRQAAPQEHAAPSGACASATALMAALRIRNLRR